MMICTTTGNQSSGHGGEWVETEEGGPVDGTIDQDVGVLEVDEVAR